MNRRMVLNIVGRMLRLEAALLLIPAIVSLIYRENEAFAFLITAAGAFLLGCILKFIFKPRSPIIYSKEGFIITALVWITMSLVGAVPFIISGEIPNFFDAFFETVSGFTTTGSSILTDVEKMSHGCLFWRSFTHWVGGMGILVFVMAIVPNISDRAIHIMRAEMPGPVIGKIVPRVKDTAKILYLIYLAITAVEVILLTAGGMPLFDSIVHSFGTAGTGGFGIKADGLASYSAYSQWVIAIFMMIFGVNFNLYFFIVIRRIRDVLRSTELWTYLGVIAISTALITMNIRSMFGSFSETVRTAFFQVSSIITTTGFATADFNLWPGFSKAIILLLMFVGGCAGSTAGGLKVSRAVLLVKQVSREFKKVLRPRSVSAVRFEGKPMDESIVHSVSVYFALYILCIAAIFLAVSFEPFGFETNFTATVTCFNNVGPGFALVGPAGNFSAYSALSKAVLSFAMLLGRLEIFPMLLLFSPSLWKRR